ncbi:MAG: choice-of-anchor D domain-containing protein [Verrucomicrobiota bacterium]
MFVLFRSFPSFLPIFRLFLIGLAVAGISQAADSTGSVTLAWDANPESDIAGYRVFYGITGGALDQSLVVGPATEVVLTGLEVGVTYYCAVQAFNTESVASPLSDEISFTLSGPALPGISLEEISGTVMLNGQGTIDFGDARLGESGPTRTFIVRNPGTADLSDLSLTIDSGDFHTTPLSTTSLTAGGNTSFSVTFSPSTGGPRTATLRLFSNAPDASPFSVTLAGNGVAPSLPVLTVETAAGTPLDAANASVSFENVLTGSLSPAESFVVRNTGTAPLTGLQVTVAGMDPGSFTIITPPPATLAPGAATTLSVAFSPTSDGPKSTALRIEADAIARSPIEIRLGGNGISIPPVLFPEIAVTSDTGGDLSSGDFTAGFGSHHLGTVSPPRTFTLRNTGGAPLTGIAITTAGSDFTIAGPGTSTLAPGASATFKVSFKPTAGGARSSRLSISSNDGDESPFFIALTGNGVQAPEIEILQAGKSLRDEAAFLNFGRAASGRKGRTLILTLRNAASAPLGNLALAKHGLHGSDFTVTALQAKSLAPGASTSLKITFKPTRQGTRWAALRISSNDADEKSFNIVLTGNGKAATSATPKKSAASITMKSAAAPLKGIEVIDGKKYRTLTLAKAPGVSFRLKDIEVSSDLVGWLSGSRHATVLIDNPTTYKVRDNTPVTADSKRHIRLKP